MSNVFGFSLDIFFFYFDFFRISCNPITERIPNLSREWLCQVRSPAIRHIDVVRRAKGLMGSNAYERKGEEAGLDQRCSQTPEIDVRKVFTSTIGEL